MDCFTLLCLNYCQSLDSTGQAQLALLDLTELQYYTGLKRVESYFFS